VAADFSVARRGEALFQKFAEGFLGFVMFVAVAKIEGVRAVADNVGTQADGVRSLLFRPIFRAC
jgi:hypothetical protein